MGKKHAISEEEYQLWLSLPIKSFEELKNQSSWNGEESGILYLYYVSSCIAYRLNNADLGYELSAKEIQAILKTHDKMELNVSYSHNAFARFTILITEKSENFYRIVDDSISILSLMLSIDDPTDIVKAPEKMKLFSYHFNRLNFIKSIYKNNAYLSSFFRAFRLPFMNVCLLNTSPLEAGIKKINSQLKDFDESLCNLINIKAMKEESEKEGDSFKEFKTLRKSDIFNIVDVLNIKAKKIIEEYELYLLHEHKKVIL